LHALTQRYVAIPRAIRSSHSDIVHILDPAYGHLIPLAAPACVVVSCHDLTPLDLPRWHRSRKALSIGWHLYRRAIRNLEQADAVIVPTASTRRRLIELIGEHETGIWTIPYGVDEAFHCARWTPPTGTLRVLHVGTNIPYKRVELVVETVLRLASRGHNVELVKAGPSLPAQLAKELGGAGIRLIQYPNALNGSLRTSAEQAAIYSEATILLFPSSHEGFGLPVAEAMAVGLPVVASDIDTLVEVSGGYASHVPADAAVFATTIEGLLGKPGALQQMSDKGRSWAGRYRWTAYADALRNVYTDVTCPAP
jgi:glycosyltransferase involved in cell wall biosynthesis